MLFASTDPPLYSYVSAANSAMLYSSPDSASTTSAPIVQRSIHAILKNVSTANTSMSTIGALTAFLRTWVTPPMLAYVLPAAFLLNLVNNSLVLVVLAGSERVRRSLPATVRLYYIAMALNDVNNSIPMQLTYFMGMFQVIGCFIRRSLEFRFSLIAECEIRLKYLKCLLEILLYEYYVFDYTLMHLWALTIGISIF